MDIQLIPAAQTRAMVMKNEIIHGASISGFWQIQAMAAQNSFQADEWDEPQRELAKALWEWLRSTAS